MMMRMVRTEMIIRIKMRITVWIGISAMAMMVIGETDRRGGM
jgi:hypothetical protein